MGGTGRGGTRAAGSAACLILLAGCATLPPPGAAPTVVARQEIELPPPPARALTIGIYSCVDTTGQRRPTQLPQELSTAVPMDCTPYVAEAARSLRPGYVVLVERQHVDELLRERQLATLALNSLPEAAKAAELRRLSTLRVAEILLIGQVVAYDRSVREITGGAAVGGTGASAAYVTDLITFNLRAVAVQTGEVLGQAMVTKSVTSLKLGGHYADIGDDIVDIEAGGAGNEPVGTALSAAARAALIQLVNQGVQDGWWT